MRDLAGEWADAAFRTRASAWVDRALLATDHRRTGELRPHKIRFWSAVFVVPLGRTRAWFKVANPGQAFEGALLSALGTLAPDHVIPPWAHDQAEGWWLLPEGGPTTDREGADQHTWEALLHSSAELQLRCQDHQRRLPMLPTLTPQEATGELFGLIEDLSGRPRDDPQQISSESAHTYLGQLDRFEQGMALLTDGAAALTVQLNDVHPGNACAPGSPGAPPRFFDLGDAFWSHPWPLLHAPLRGAAGVRLADPLPDLPLVRRLAHAYLEHWPAVAPGDREDLLQAADRLGSLHRAASWRRLLAPTDPATLGMPPPRVSAWVAQALGLAPQP